MVPFSAYWHAAFVTKAVYCTPCRNKTETQYLQWNNITLNKSKTLQFWSVCASKMSFFSFLRYALYEQAPVSNIGRDNFSVSNNSVGAGWPTLSTTLFLFFITELCCWWAGAWPWCWSCGWRWAWPWGWACSLPFLFSPGVTVTFTASFATCGAFTALGRAGFGSRVGPTAAASGKRKPTSAKIH